MISIRGTDPARLKDVIQDAYLWMEIAMIKITSVVFVTSQLWDTTFLATIIGTAFKLQNLFPDKGHTQAFYHSIEEYIARKKKERGDGWRMVVTGHSLGAGLATIVGSHMDIPVVAWSPPGVLLSRKKFHSNHAVYAPDGRGDASRVRLRELGKNTISILPSWDPVPMADQHFGEIHTTQCSVDAAKTGLTPINCHMIGQMVCDLLQRCGDHRPGRFSNCKFEVNAFNKVLEPMISQIERGKRSTVWPALKRLQKWVYFDASEAEEQRVALTRRILNATCLRDGDRLQLSDVYDSLTKLQFEDYKPNCTDANERLALADAHKARDELIDLRIKDLDLNWKPEDEPLIYGQRHLAEANYTLRVQVRLGAPASSVSTSQQQASATQAATMLTSLRERVDEVAGALCWNADGGVVAWYKREGCLPDLNKASRILTDAIEQAGKVRMYIWENTVPHISLADLRSAQMNLQQAASFLAEEQAYRSRGALKEKQSHLRRAIQLYPWIRLQEPVEEGLTLRQMATFSDLGGSGVFFVLSHHAWGKVLLGIVSTYASVAVMRWTVGVVRQFYGYACAFRRNKNE